MMMESDGWRPEGCSKMFLFLFLQLLSYINFKNNFTAMNHRTVGAYR